MKIVGLFADTVESFPQGSQFLSRAHDLITLEDGLLLIITDDHVYLQTDWGYQSGALPLQSFSREEE